MARTKNKTLAALLAAVGGSLGLHRFYLYGLSDGVAWLFPIPTALGWWGVERVREFGQDDRLSWVLIPLLGFTLAISCLVAVVYVLMPQEKWNARHNPQAPADAPAGRSSGLTILVLIFAMLAGTTAFMGSLAFSFQRYFEYQIDEARKLSQ
jgi:flagellar basal body-associated protein FliL